MSSTRIVARTNDVGMGRDVRLLMDAFAEWTQEPAFSRYRSISPLRRVLDRRHPGETLVFLERITSRWLRRAGRYVLIPNQERFPRRQVRLLKHIDHIFCKSEHAREIFAEHHPSVHFLGFTSVDRGLPGATPDYGRFFHLGGGSSLKGTPMLLDLWRRHPEWPRLTVAWHRTGQAPGPLPPNVELIERYLPDDELRALQNACGVQLCPSLSEGWGHYIVEAMSCRAVAVVTDGPPMNELVSPERGVVVPHHRSEPRKLGVNFYVDPEGLEEAVAALIRAPEAEKRALGDRARAWYESNDAAFRARLRELWERLLG